MLYIQHSTVCHPATVGITEKVLSEANSAVHRCLCEGRTRESICFSIHFSYNDFDFSNLNCYTIKLHLVINLNPSVLPEMQAAGYVVFNIQDLTALTSRKLWFMTSLALLEMVGNLMLYQTQTLIAAAAFPLPWTLATRSFLLTSPPSFQALTAAFFCSSGLLSLPGPATSVQSFLVLPWELLPLLFKAILRLIFSS